MSDIIHLLPDSIANQIAAGEVIQRPSSVIKELVENALDAGSTEIRIILKNAGKTLIQVIDNGKGMSYIDARMSFERHATSKISTADDLFELHTLGFRGEALASIAAISHVELKTQQQEEEMGTLVRVEGSTVVKHDVGRFPHGTNLSVKNLFYNVPARRKFLKSDPVELRHIMDEFTRLVLANPNVFFSLFHNENELYHLPPSNFRQRIINIFGKNANEKIVPVSEETDFLKVSGFVGKPDFAKKSRGEQFLFVNDRFIKSNYLNHAVRSAFDNILSKEMHPFFVLLLDVPPDSLDINIHPTKQEVKFENERLIYNYIRVSVKHALGKYSIAPVIDFDEENTFNHRPSVERPTQWSPSSSVIKKNSFEKDEWVNIYERVTSDISEQRQEAQPQISFTPVSEESSYESNSFRTSQGYIINPIKSGFVIIDQQSAHERIVYERCLRQMNSGIQSSQKSLFPETIELSAKDATLLQDLMPNLKLIGLDIERFGNRTYVIQGLPSGSTMNGKQMIQNLLQDYSENPSASLGVEEKLAAAFARQTRIKRSKQLNKEEMRNLIDDLFACEMPYSSPSGHKCFVTVREEEIKNYFN